MVIKDLRGKAGSWFVKILLVLIILSFMMFGIQGYFQSTYSGDVVAKVDGTTITKHYVKQKLQDTLKQFGGDVSMEKALKMGLGRLVLEEIIAEILVGKEMEHLKLTVGEKSIDLALRLDPTFHEEGKGFSPQKLRDFLQHSGMSEKALLSEIKRHLMQQQLLVVLNTPTALPDGIAAPLFEALIQERDLEMIIFDAKTMKVPPPSDANLEKYYNAHKESFRTPEKRKVAMLVLDPLKLVGNRSFTDDELQIVYEQHIADFSTPEKRHVVVVSLKSEKEYGAIKAALLKGQKVPDSLDLGLKTMGELDPQLASAAFSLKKGEVSAPVKTAHGVKVVHVKGVTPPVIHSFAAVRSKIIEKARKEEGQKALTELVAMLEDQISGGADLKKLATEHKLALTETGLETRQSLAAKGLPSTVLEQAFQQEAKADGQFMDLDGG
jgi:peptidyl-prolyl cis-trans isomerase D